jgi:hypothetical protein
LEPAKPEPEIDPASIPLPESDNEEVVEPYGIPGPSNTSAPEPEHIQEASEPEISESNSEQVIDKNLEDLYNSVRSHWKADDGDPEEFDWEVLAMEIDELSNSGYNRSYCYCIGLNMALQDYRYKVNGKHNAEVRPSNAEIAQTIRKYANEIGGEVPVEESSQIDEKEQVQIISPVGIKKVPIKEVNEKREQEPETPPAPIMLVAKIPPIDEREYALANGYEVYSDCEDEDDELDEVVDEMA